MSEGGGGELTALRADLARLGRAPSPLDIAASLRRTGGVVSDDTVLATAEALRRDSTGAGPLTELLARPGVTDVLVNGPDQVFVDRGHGLEPVDVRFGSDAEVRALAQRLAAAAGRRLDTAQPYVDARMADGVRVHAVLAGVAQPGTCLSLRVPARRRVGLSDWMGGGVTIGARLLGDLVAARVAFLVSGGTGSGKTTLLATLLGLVPPDQRILVVEDSRELTPDHPHVVSLEARTGNSEAAGAIPLAQLVRQALRMRPDRLVVGEVRGGEVVDLLAALNTGHEGGCGTVHANSAADVPARLEALAALAGLSRDALHAQLASAVRVVVHVVRRGSHRSVAELDVLTREADGLVRATPAVCFDTAGRAHRGPAAPQLERILDGAAQVPGAGADGEADGWRGRRAR